MLWKEKGEREQERSSSLDWKQRERAERIASLPPVYHQALTASDVTILSTPVSDLVQKVQSGTWDPVEVLRSYGKKTLKAQEATNCLTEIMIGDAEKWAKNVNKTAPLAGVPVSLKDTLAVQGYDTCFGYSSLAGKPATKESALVRLLRDAGAVPFVKTAVPITLLSFESHSSVFGAARNPHVRTHTPGGSTGGEAALLAFGGSRIGIGTDVAGSVRVPAHFSGIYTIKASTGRCPRTGGGTSIPGQEGVPPVYSPMARTLEDLEYFWKVLVSMEPWEYDHSCHPIPWRDINLQGKKLTWGVMLDDGVVPPSPACERALRMVVDLLGKNGHRVIQFNPPSPYEALQIGSQLLASDGAEIVMRPFQFLEPNDPGLHKVIKLLRLPSIIRTLYTWYYRYIRRDPITAGLISGMYRKTTAEHYGLVAQREGYRARFFEAWQEARIDFLLTVPNATPALPLGGMKNTIASIGYSFLFNILDYSAGVLPVTKVSSAIDDLSPKIRSQLPKLNRIARDAYRNYDAKAMDGLPVGVQIIGRRLEEEKVMEGMKIVQSLLLESDQEYKLINL
ncbi:amidase signature domain-containing protein [Hysterangium stoloniferum]|nr:amidase signature domain-containing protein [Hysterangium stoloniferum]